MRFDVMSRVRDPLRAHEAEHSTNNEDMRYLLSPPGERRLRELAGSHTLYAFDFDGTLAPIVSDPERARASTGVLRLLDELARTAPVAVISGRRRSDLVPRVPPSVRYLVGNHGNEGAQGVDMEAMRVACEAWRHQLSAHGPEMTELGITLEDKTYSLALHYRLARQREAAAAMVYDLASQLAPAPRLIGGKYLLNLLAPSAQTKFEALVSLAAREHAAHVLFVGDDDTDEFVFAQAPAHWTTVRVELEQSSSAQYFLHQQSGVAMLLDFLVREQAGRESGVGNREFARR